MVGEPGSGALTRLTEVSRALTYAVSLDEVLEITVDCAVDLLAADRALLLLKESDDLLTIRAARGVDPEIVDRFHEPLDETLIRRLQGALGPTAAEQFLGVPLVVRGRVIGLLAVLSGGSQGASERDEWLLAALADQAAVALEAARGETRREGLQGRVAELEGEGAQHETTLRMVGHDLRTPLNAIQGYVQLLHQGSYGDVSDPQRGALDRILSITRHLGSLVDNILEMGRITAGTLDIRTEELDAAEVVAEAEQMVDVAASERGIEVRVTAEPDVRARADRDRMRQVLVHLLDNAVKYSPDGGVVRIDVARAESGGRDVVRIRVQDEGDGVPPEDAESIFEPYRRLATEDTMPSGAGLGLAIARSLVQLMDGRLRLDDTAEGGATFELDLPAA